MDERSALLILIPLTVFLPFLIALPGRGVGRILALLFSVGVLLLLVHPLLGLASWVLAFLSAFSARRARRTEDRIAELERRSGVDAA